MIELERVEAEQDVTATAHRMFHLLLEVLGPLSPDLSAESATPDREHLAAILGEETTEVAGGELAHVSAQEEEETLHTWHALNGLFERLGPARIAGVERQTDLRQLPQDVVQAIDMHLDDERLSNLGKILAISHLLLGETYPNQ